MIVVVGSINLDLIGRVEDLPKPGQTITGSDFASAPGGKGANQALAARRAGCDVRMIGAVADDANAKSALSLLSEAGVDLTGIKHRSAADSATGVALILVANSSGENQIAVIPGANATLGADDMTDADFAGADYLLLQMEVPAQTNQDAMRKAKAAGVKSILNIAPYGQDAPDLARMADYVIANETEFNDLADALSLSGKTRIEKAQDFSQNTGNHILITLGADGVIGVADEEPFEVAAFDIKPVDTVGAGDTFCGAFAVALSEGKNIADAARFACGAGALACLKEGAQPSIPERSAIDAMVKS